MFEKQLPYKVKVYEEIKHAILCGNYVPGDVLNERELSEKFGISRTPIREAIQLLARDGWVQVETYKGAVVRTFNRKHMLDLSRIRTALEVCAVEEATGNVTDASIAELEAIQAEQWATTQQFDVQKYIHCDRKFHDVIYGLSQNQELIRLLSNYYDIFQLMGVRAAISSQGRPEGALQEHQAVLDALKKRDVSAAANAMRIHMRETEQNMLSQIEKGSPAT